MVNDPLIKITHSGNSVTYLRASLITKIAQYPGENKVCYNSYSKDGNPTISTLLYVTNIDDIVVEINNLENNKL